MLGLGGNGSVRKVIVGFLLLVSALAFFMAFSRAQSRAITTIESAGAAIGQPLWIPASALFSQPGSWQVVEPILDQAAKQADVNLIRTDMGYTAQDRPEITQYVLLTHPTQLFRPLSLVSGRFLEPGMGTEAFLSSQQTGNPHQVGVLQEFGGQPLVFVRPMVQAAQYLPLAGSYRVEGAPRAYTRFLRGFVAGINAHFPKSMTRPYRSTDFEHANGTNNFTMPVDFGAVGGTLSSATHSLQVVGILVFVITLLLVIYYGFHAAKRIGVMKMHGWSNGRIWATLIGRRIALTFGISAAALVVVALLIPGTTGTFVASVMGLQAMAYALVGLSSGLLYIQARRLRVGDAVKGRQRTTAILAANSAVKVGWSVVLGILILSLAGQLAQLQAQRTLLNRWVKSGSTQGYGVFYPASVGHDLVGTAQGGLTWAYREAGWLYPRLVRQGAVYIDASAYTTTMLQLPETPGYVPSVTVNPNYLQQFPVYSTHHRVVQIPEHTQNWVLLVPVRDRAEKAQILRFVHQQLDGSRAHTGFVNTPMPPRFRHQAVRIIWVANGQRLFSFNPAVYPHHHNMITSPIIQVATLGNTVPTDMIGMISGSPAGAVKVRLAGSPAATYHGLLPLLTRLKLQDTLRTLTGINGAIAQAVRTLQLQMLGLGLAVLVLLAGAVALAGQNLTIVFARYRRQFAVRRLFGYGLLRTYREPAQLFAGMWTVQTALVIVLSVALSGGGPGAPPTGALAVHGILVGVAVVVVEVVTAVIAVRRTERRNIARTLKEGHAE